MIASQLAHFVTLGSTAATCSLFHAAPEATASAVGTSAGTSPAASASFRDSAGFLRDHRRGGRFSLRGVGAVLAVESASAAALSFTTLSRTSKCCDFPNSAKLDVFSFQTAGQIDLNVAGEAL